MQWRIQGGTRGPAPLIFRPNLLSQGLHDRLNPSPLPEGLDPPTQKTSCTRTLIRKC